MTVIDLTAPAPRLADLVAELGGVSRRDAEAALADVEHDDDPWWQVASGLVSLRRRPS